MTPTFAPGSHGPAGEGRNPRSPLPDSNRRPLPYHDGAQGHGNAADTGGTSESDVAQRAATEGNDAPAVRATFARQATTECLNCGHTYTEHGGSTTGPCTSCSCERWHDVEDEMRAVLAKLAVVSHGTIYSYNPIGSKGGFGERDGGDGRPPGGELLPPHDRWADEFNRAPDDARRLAALEGATDELERLTHRVLPDGYREQPETDQERTTRLIDDGAGIPLHEAAHRLNCPPSELLRLRKNASRDAYTGWPFENATAANARQKRADRVRELKQRHPGMSNRQIGEIVGCDHKTVASDLRSAA